MRLVLLFLLACQMPSALSGQESGFFSEEEARLEVQVFPLRLGQAGGTVNCYLAHFTGSREALIIDPGAPSPALREAISRQGLQVLAVLNTHGHHDHVGNDAALARELSVPVFLHAADLSLAAETLGSANPFSPFPDHGKLILGGLEIEVLHTPGHSPGSVCLKIADALFSGDTLFAGSVGKPPGRDAAGRRVRLQQEVEAIRALLLPLPPLTRVFPGHGPATTLAAERAFNPFLR